MFLLLEKTTGILVLLNLKKSVPIPKKSAWTVSVVNTVVTANFKKNASVALDYISGRAYPGSIMNKMLVFMDLKKLKVKTQLMNF